MDYKVTRNDCSLVIEELIRIFKTAGLENEISLLVYGSYFEVWNNGMSDLDAMIYFSQIPLGPPMRSKIQTLQSEIGRLYKKFKFLKNGHFFADVFVLDSLHGSDGRFMIFDQGFIDRILIGRAQGIKIHTETQTKHSVLFGRDFVEDLNPVSLRHQDEFELAIGLCKLRNYLFFEIPRQEVDLNYAKDIIMKFFKILPRTVAIIIREPLINTPEVLKSLRDYFEDIDFAPLVNLWHKMKSRKLQEEYIRSWHKYGNSNFLKCLECYEKVLKKLVQHESMRSRKED